MECDRCLKHVGEIRKFTTYQPSKGIYEEHFVCDICIAKLVENYFSLVNVL